MELWETFVRAKTHGVVLARFFRFRSGTFFNCLPGSGGYKWRWAILLWNEGDGTKFLTFRNLKGDLAQHDLKKKCHIPFSDII
jgi:hypothetical protein